MAIVKLSNEQRKRLVNIIAQHGNVASERKREYFLVNTDLKTNAPRVSEINREGSADEFAQEVIIKCQEWGTLQATRQPALVLVLRYLRDEKLTGHEEEHQLVSELLAPYDSPVHVDIPSINTNPNKKVKEATNFTKESDTTRPKGSYESPFSALNSRQLRLLLSVFFAIISIISLLALISDIGGNFFENLSLSSPTVTVEPTITQISSTPTTGLLLTETPTRQVLISTLTATNPTAIPSQTPVRPTVTPSITLVPPTNTLGPITGRILLTSIESNDIYVVNVDGTDITRLTTIGNCRDARFSPDGKTIIFLHEGDIWKMNADGTGQVNLTNTPDSEEDHPIVFGSKIAFNLRYEGYYFITVMNMDGSNKHPIDRPGPNLFPAWSPGGSKIAYISLNTNTEIWDIWTSPIDGLGFQQVTNFSTEMGVLSPIWSPDSSKIAFSTKESEISDTREIWTIPSIGGNPTKIGSLTSQGLNSASRAQLVAWHGDKILIYGYDGRSNSYFINADGSGEPVKVPLGNTQYQVTDWLQ